MSSLDLSPGAEGGGGKPKIRRLNKLPVFLFIGLVVLFFGVIIWGLSIRGLNRSGGAIEHIVDNHHRAVESVIDDAVFAA